MAGKLHLLRKATSTDLCGPEHITCLGSYESPRSYCVGHHALSGLHLLHRWYDQGRFFQSQDDLWHPPLAIRDHDTLEEDIVGGDAKS